MGSSAGGGDKNPFIPKAFCPRKGLSERQFVTPARFGRLDKRLQSDSTAIFGEEGLEAQSHRIGKGGWGAIVPVTVTTGPTRPTIKKSNFNAAPVGPNLGKNEAIAAHPPSHVSAWYFADWKHLSV